MIEKEKLMRALHILVNNLDLSARKRLADFAVEILDEDVDSAQMELNFIKKCVDLNAYLRSDNDFASGLSKKMQFIKNDQGSESNLKRLLEEIFEDCVEEFGDEYVNKIVEIVFQ